MKDERKERVEKIISESKKIDRVASNSEVDKALKEAMRKYNFTFKRLAE